MKQFKLVGVALALLVLAGCGDHPQDQRIGQKATSKTYPPYIDTTYKGVRKYCIDGVLYHGWLTAGNGDWAAPAYDPETSKVIPCNFSQPRY